MAGESADLGSGCTSGLICKELGSVGTRAVHAEALARLEEAQGGPKQKDLSSTLLLPRFGLGEVSRGYTQLVPG